MMIEWLIAIVVLVIIFLLFRKNGTTVKTTKPLPSLPNQRANNETTKPLPEPTSTTNQKKQVINAKYAHKGTLPVPPPKNN
jgi:cell division protein FtsN